MPVIGRLDGQVDEVLIKPVSRGRRGGGEEAPAGADDEAAPAPAPPAETQTPRADESSGGAAELPVWLL